MNHITPSSNGLLPAFKGISFFCKSSSKAWISGVAHDWMLQLRFRRLATFSIRTSYGRRSQAADLFPYSVVQHALRVMLETGLYKDVNMDICCTQVSKTARLGRNETANAVRRTNPPLQHPVPLPRKHFDNTHRPSCVTGSNLSRAGSAWQSLASHLRSSITTSTTPPVFPRRHTSKQT